VRVGGKARGRASCSFKKDGLDHPALLPTGILELPEISEYNQMMWHYTVTRRHNLYGAIKYFFF
jgi:hypothetical protein